MWIVKLILFLFIVEVKIVELKKFQIVGGTVTQISQFPYLGAYHSNREFVCSCILVTSSFAITAGHCTYYYPWSISVRFGSSFRDREGALVNVSRFYQHPNFNIKNYDYDISLLKFTKAMRFTMGIYPIKLPVDENDLLDIGTSLRVAGWGMQSYDDVEAPVALMTTTVQVTDFGNCSRNYQLVAQSLTDRMFCASAPNTDACLGDSGGPLVLNNTLYGIVSFGYGCALKDYPGIYSKVSYLLPWVKRIFQQFS